MNLVVVVVVVVGRFPRPAAMRPALHPRTRYRTTGRMPGFPRTGRRPTTARRCLPGVCTALVLASCGTTSPATPDERLGTLSATDLGVGRVVRLTVELPAPSPPPVEVAVLRRDDGFPEGLADPKAATVYRGPPLVEYFDADATPQRVSRYAVFFSGGDRGWRRGPTAEIRLGPLPVTGLRVTDPGRGRRLELSWTTPPCGATDLVRILRFVDACPEDPDPTAFDRRIDLAIAGHGRTQAWTDDQVVDDLTYCYAVFTRSSANYLYSPGAFTRGSSTDSTPTSAVSDAAATRPPVDDDGDGYREDQGDCDDADARVHPGAASLDCSATDWNCDGAGWEDSFCRSSAPAWLDEQCSRRSPAYSCLAGAGCDWNVLPDLTPCSVATEPDYAYDICVAGACRSPGTCGDATCNSPGPHFRLPPAAGRHDFARTGDTEPVVTDPVTGLVWQGCPAGTAGSDCGTGERASLDWRAALAWCDGLMWGGRDDWRLPDRYELMSVIDHARVGPAADTAAFPETSDYFWSSSSYVAGSLLVWSVYFNSGNLSLSHREARQFVRCVRDGAAPAPGPAGWKRFRRAEPAPGQPVVADIVTGLAWQGCAAGLADTDCSTGQATMLDWSAARARCEALVWAGADDWRLPDPKELDSILDAGRRSPAIDPEAFPGTPVGWYWAALPYAGGPSTHAWHVNFSSGHVANFDRTLPCYVRCVRSATP
ncbi:MAG: DUF1566 domain-containing protein [Deltaproteobacteria bacterium]|nr:DUF1566 domain-containing protein [Deltaproteobacteria bacterium]